MNGCFTLEQPFNSVLEFYPRWQWLIQQIRNMKGDVPFLKYLIEFLFHETFCFSLLCNIIYYIILIMLLPVSVWDPLAVTMSPSPAFPRSSKRLGICSITERPHQSAIGRIPIPHTSWSCGGGDWWGGRKDPRKSERRTKPQLPIRTRMERPDTKAIPT